MLRKKKTEKRQIKRIQRRRTKTFIQIAVFTFLLSGAAVAGAWFFARNQAVISPLPVLSMTSTSDPVRVAEYELKKLQISVEKITEQGDSLVIMLGKNQEAVIATDGNIAKQLASLQLITRQLTMEGKHFSRIDLRFDKPVVSLAQ
jgi:hypothetical protein